MPWELLRFSAHDKKYILDIPRETIKKGAGYDSMDKVLDKADTNWLGDKFIAESGLLPLVIARPRLSSFLT